MTFDGLKEMRVRVNERIDELYSWWLLDKHSEDIGNDKDKHIDMVCQGIDYEEFLEWLEEGK